MKNRSKAAAPLLLALVAAVMLSSCGKYVIWTSHHNPLKSYAGLTAFHPWMTDIFQIIDMDGNIMWEILGLPINNEESLDFEIMDNGNILFEAEDIIFMLKLPDTILWTIPAENCHHSVLKTSKNTIMYLFAYDLPVDGWDLPFRADGIREVNPITGETEWEWLTGDHLSTDDYCPHHMEPPGGNPIYDWTHSNTVRFDEEDSAVYLNSRHLDRIVKIDYPSGEILWSMGGGGDFGEGLFSHAHDPEFLENGNMLIYDNGNHREPEEYSRAVEIAFDAELGWAHVVWDWPREPLFFDSAMGDANRLPNGNTLITSSHHSRLFEVTRNGELVWELLLDPVDLVSLPPIMYKSERFPADVMNNLVIR